MLKKEQNRLRWRNLTFFRISQIINNLFSNAIKFTEKGHVKTILKLVTVKEHKCKINFRIEDTGSGIREDKISSVFEAFTQTSSSNTLKYGGTGIGLAIVKRLVELHNSNIRVPSTQNVGTVFEFDLNLKCVDEYNIAQNHELENKKKSLTKASILVAEDNLVNQMLIKKFLKKWHVGNLVIASDGQEAIEVFEQLEFDLVLLDIQMPVLDGFEVAKWIREHKDADKKNTPILMLSATSHHEIKTEMLKAGINDFIEKPFTPEGLYGKLTEFLNWKDLS